MPTLRTILIPGLVLATTLAADAQVSPGSAMPATQANASVAAIGGIAEQARLNPRFRDRKR